MNAADDPAIRKFLEREFSLYAIRNKDRSLEGVITGYYEPLLNGSRTRGGPFIHPVYATPRDLLTLDIRRVPAKLRGQPIGARIEGRTVVPILDGTAPYVVDLAGFRASTLDKKLRVRREGNRIVPYPVRARIEREGLTEARVLAWVDNPGALYSMQIQGSGRVLLQDGQVVRLAYAQQNGHPFKPPVRKRRSPTRSIGGDTDDPGDGVDDENFDDMYWRQALMMPETYPFPEPRQMTRGGLSSRVERSAADNGAGSAGASLTSEVGRLIEELASGRRVGDGSSDLRAASTQPPSDASAAVDASRAEGEQREAAPGPEAGALPQGTAQPESAERGKQPMVVARPTTAASSAAPIPVPFPQPSPAMRRAILEDPSYVFFREIPDGPGGPIGALGVPLTAGRSVAVDPRTTPLGSPVFLSITQPGRVDFVSRLVVAQDTGGAIRGAVRADYFWGFGHSAYVEAARMKENGRMWVLLPRDLPIAARDKAIRTRGIRSEVAEFDCVVEDPDVCVEDQ